jgi:hypothetical protein
MLIVAGYRKAGDDLGYHIEITGVRVAEAKSISVQTVSGSGITREPPASVRFLKQRSKLRA